MSEADPAPATRIQWLRLADAVAGMDADTGDPAVQAELSAAVEAIAHALVDLADGAAAPTVPVSTSVPEPGLSDEPPTASRADRLLALDVASCSALGARLRQVSLRVSQGQATDPSLADAVTSAAAALSAALQSFAQDLAPLTRGDGADPAGHARAERNLGRAVQRAHDLVRAPSVR
ncbi:MAG: hypothetical protein M3424_04345 [Actinomycetota bacterium]|jgi:hypothetical protein|nr:hypothetical protein [Actinomycetota bacterium]MDQ3527111.1 hypothetical protein [Actinomycetota bacterium]